MYLSLRVSFVDNSSLLSCDDQSPGMPWPRQPILKAMKPLSEGSVSSWLVQSLKMLEYEADSGMGNLENRRLKFKHFQALRLSLVLVQEWIQKIAIPLIRSMDENACLVAW